MFDFWLIWSLEFDGFVKQVEVGPLIRAKGDMLLTLATGADYDNSIVYSRDGLYG